MTKYAKTASGFVSIIKAIASTHLRELGKANVEDIRKSW